MTGIATPLAALGQGLPSATQPQIVSAPSDVTLYAGDSLILRVEAVGTAPLTYQWTRGGQALPRATNQAFEVSAARVSDSGTYSVKVSNAAGSVTSRGATVAVIDDTLRTQAIGLSPGWNLVSLQVGPAFDLERVRASLANKLVSVWAYDPTARDWLYHHATEPTHPHTLTTLRPGQGYWMQLSAAHTLTLTGQVWHGGVRLVPGWNLVGFPGLNDSTSEGTPLESVFRTNLARISQVWAWESGAAQRFVGHDKTALPPLDQLTGVRPGTGYWVRSLDTLEVSPQPEIILPGDLDLPPLQPPDEQRRRRAGPEDLAAGTDLNGNGFLDDAFSQDTLVFRPGQSQQLIRLSNGGLGQMDWEALEEIPWLGLDQTSGSVAAADGQIRVIVDRSGLSTGTYGGSFPVRLGALRRTVQVLLQVAPPDGDYRGFASTVRVNGKPISLGKVDLNLTVFRDAIADGSRDLRAVINRERSLLFPRDVFLSGTFFQGNDFFLTTNFEVPEGDRNVPPFEVFADGAGYSSGGLPPIAPDRDVNGDGRLDNGNPFPFSLRREITLIGQRLDENRLKGTYYESIQNILPGGQRISIEGDFELERLSFTPSLTSIYNRNLTTNLVIGASTPSALTNEFRVPVAGSLQGVTVGVNLDFALGSNVTVTVVSPAGQSYLFANDPFRGSRTVDVTAFNGQAGAGTWKLIVAWLPNGERGFFQGWSLNLKGIAVHEARGSIVAGPTNAPTPLMGARVTLAGNNFVEQRLLAGSADFAFTNLTENDFTLTVSRVGFQDAVRGFSITDRSTNLGAIHLEPLTNAEPALVTAPWIGGQPLTVNFAALLPLTTLDSLGTILSNSWSFGDGTLTNFLGEASTGVEHTYSVAGRFTATNRIHGSRGSLTLVSRPVTVLPQGPLPQLTMSLWGLANLGSLASPVEALPPGVSPLRPVELRVTNPVLLVDGVAVTRTNVPTGVVHQENQRDVAAFDIDRWPLESFGLDSTHPEDTDFFAPPATTGNGRYDSFIPPVLANNPTNRFRLVTTLGGSVFGTAPSRVGPYVLEASRIEP